jgi:hypothetical protein
MFKLIFNVFLCGLADIKHLEVLRDLLRKLGCLLKMWGEPVLVVMKGLCRGDV